MKRLRDLLDFGGLLILELGEIVLSTTLVFDLKREGEKMKSRVCP